MSLSRRLAAFLLTPLGALLLLAVTIPAAMLLAFSFFRINELLQLVPGFTVGNYRSVLTTPLYRSYAWNTLLIAAPTALLAVLGGYVLAYYLAFRARRSRGILLVAIVIALMGSYLALVYSWRTLSGEHGIINSLLEAARVTRGPLGILLFSRLAVITAEVNFFLPLTTGSSQVVWQRAVPLEIQGRVFAARTAIAMSVMPLASLAAGPLADRLFEPAMRDGGRWAAALGPFVGTGPGRGIALIFVGSGALIACIAFVASRLAPLRRLDGLPEAPALVTASLTR